MVTKTGRFKATLHGIITQCNVDNIIQWDNLSVSNLNALQQQVEVVSIMGVAAVHSETYEVTYMCRTKEGEAHIRLTFIQDELIVEVERR